MPKGVRRPKAPSKYELLRENAVRPSKQAVYPENPCPACKNLSFRPGLGTWHYICNICHPDSARAVSVRTDRDLTAFEQKILAQAQAKGYLSVVYDNARPYARVAAGEACWIAFLRSHLPESYPDLAYNLAQVDPDRHETDIYDTWKTKNTASAISAPTKTA